MPLPAPFVHRMRALLGSEAEELLAALADQPRAGLRANPLKVDPAELQRMAPWPLEPVPWCPSGFLLAGEEAPGRHPYHAAGLFYLQEPSAMAVAEALAPRPGERVLDLAAAPGGKATHLSALMGDSGVLVANEVEGSRARALASNLERWGTRHALITREPPDRLAARWGAVFHRVTLDAPCSGEGMFRKSEAALADWSEESVRGCGLRQERLLLDAAELVLPGGLLAYSTCTFAPEENERVIDRFLGQRPDYQVEPVSLPGAAPGRPDWVEGDPPRPELAGAARFWPHRVAGEGHFIALLRRTGGEEGRWQGSSAPAPAREARELWRSFVESTLASDPAAGAELAMFGEQLHALSPELPSTERVRTLRSGLWLGTPRRGRFEPSHALALALRARDSLRRLELEPQDPRLDRYLQGHPLPEPGAAGWLLVTVSGFPVGWGRRAQGIVKNAYPKGLRRPPS